MKPIYNTLALASTTLQISLSLQAKVTDGTEESETPIPADILDSLRVGLVAPDVSGARDLINGGECTLNGNKLDVVLATNDWIKGGVYRLQVSAIFGTQTRVIYVLDVSVPRYNVLADEPQEYDDTVTVVSTVGDGAGAQSVTHAELVTMRGNAQLVAGAWYRITDFVTTVANKDYARSAGHAFDVLVRALDSSTLDENARAIQHAGDTYFADCNLAAWELKYSLNNDTERFSWADKTNGKGVIWFMRDEWNNSAFYDFKNVQFKRWAVKEIQDANGNRLNDPTSTFAYNIGTQEIRYGYQGENYNNGKYLFVVNDADNFDWYYAFTWINENNEVKDATIVGHKLLSDEGFSYGVHDNERGACFVSNAEISKELMRDLDNGVRAATYTYEDGLFYGMYGTKTGNNCYSWTCGNDCSSWTCGHYYRYFTLEDGVQYVNISCGVTTSSSAYAQNILVHSGVKGTVNSHVTCNIATANNDFLTEFGTVVQGTI